MENKKITTSLGVLIIIIFAITIGIIIFYFEKGQLTEEQVNQITIQSNGLKRKQPTKDLKNPSNLEKINEYEEKVSGCLLKRKIVDTEEIVFSNENCYLPILKWNDYLIFPEGDGYGNEDVKLVIYKINSGDKTFVYSLNEHSGDYQKKPYEVNPINIFDKKLYFHAGGYLTDQLIYSIDLEKQKFVPKLISVDSQYFDIEFADGHYWISGGIGDAGYSASKRSLFDIDSQKIVGQNIITSSDMGFGTVYLGSDEKNAYIGTFVENPSPKSEDDKLNPILSEIHSFDLMKNNNSKVIIKKSEMPAGIIRAVYIYDKKSIVLIGETAFLYDIDEKKIETIANLSAVNLSGPVQDKSFGNMVCLTENSSLDIDKKIIVSDEKNCKWGDEGNKLDEAIKSFNLPSDYIYISNK